jgi:hypothetical protein
MTGCSQSPAVRNRKNLSVQKTRSSDFIWSVALYIKALLEVKASICLD